MPDTQFAESEVVDLLNLAFQPFVEPAWFAEVAHLAPPAKLPASPWVSTLPAEPGGEPEPVAESDVSPDSWPDTSGEFELPSGYDYGRCPMGDGSFDLAADAA
jgi:hypothetical protein